MLYLGIIIGFLSLELVKFLNLDLYWSPLLAILLTSQFLGFKVIWEAIVSEFKNYKNK
jgi:hypothetical protein